MNRTEYETQYRLEESYWWYVGQRFLLQHFLNENYPRRNNLMLLDVGCGTGRNLVTLNAFGNAMGIDISDYAREFSEKRGFTIKRNSVTNIDYAADTFDVVSSMGVFYHRGVEDDLKGFCEIYRILKRNGHLFFFDSAMPCLYGNHDIAFHGVRRYSKNSLKLKLSVAGFYVDEIRYANSLIFPSVYLKRKLEQLWKRQPQSEVREINLRLNSILRYIYLLELKSLRYSRCPFGVNILAVARKG